MIWWHADDLGLSPHITKTIADCFDVINSVSVIVNGTDVDGAVQAVKTYNKAHTHPLRVVLHLNFMEGNALAGKSPFAPTGVFEKDFVTFWMYAICNHTQKHALQDAIYAETLHQIQAFESAFGTIPTYVDSHQHFHMIPIVARAVARACAQKNISYIRIPNDVMFVRPPMGNMAKYAVLKMLAWRNRGLWKRYGMQASAEFFGVLPTGTANLDIYKPVLKYIQVHKDIEILFHMGQASASEYKQWQNRPDLWAYYTSPMHTQEATVLRQLYTMATKDTHHV